MSWVDKIVFEFSKLIYEPIRNIQLKPNKIPISNLGFAEKLRPHLFTKLD